MADDVIADITGMTLILGVIIYLSLIRTVKSVSALCESVNPIIYYMPLSVFSPRLNKDVATREQYPLKLAFSLSIHKAQGMTLSRVEIDCREIFKAGQLGVAMPRATQSDGLRIINFHPRYVIPPPKSVTEFMKELTGPVLSDLTCCMSIQRRSSGEDAGTSQTAPTSSIQSDDLKEPEQEQDSGLGEEEFDDDFDSVIQSIISEEEQEIDFDIPEDFDINKLMKDMKYKKEVTKMHTEINEIISRVQRERLTLFVKKLFFKLAQLLEKAAGKKNPVQGIAEKQLALFYRESHEFSTGAEHALNTLSLYETEKYVSHSHMIIAYNILEAIRVFLLNKKVDLLKITDRSVTKRYLTNSSRARVRYVAGYCIAKLRRKYMQMQKSNMFSVSRQGQDSYKEAKCAVQVLNLLKEEEYFLKATTNEPDSLIDVERRQYASHGLTNVTDDLFNFFLLMNFGKDMMSNCTELISKDTPLYEQFVRVVGCAYSSVEDFDQNANVADILDAIVEQSSTICRIYSEIIHNYLLVLLAQFRSDVKNVLEKKMAHKKQIKVSKQKKSKSDSVKPQPEVVPETVAPEPVSIEADQEPQAGPSHQSMPASEEEESTEPSQSTAFSAELGEELQSEPSCQQMNVSEEEDSEQCQKCFTEKTDQWIQCDSCDLWFHRKCAGLRNAKSWKKACKVGNSWNCQNCK